jgi:hypothetical protein
MLRHFLRVCLVESLFHVCFMFPSGVSFHPVSSNQVPASYRPTRIAQVRRLLAQLQTTLDELKGKIEFVENVRLNQREIINDDEPSKRRHTDTTVKVKGSHLNAGQRERKRARREASEVEHVLQQQGLSQHRKLQNHKEPSSRSSKPSPTSGGRTVSNNCQECILCQRNKDSTGKPIGDPKIPDIPLRPWESIAIDFLGPFNVSSL